MSPKSSSSTLASVPTKPTLPPPSASTGQASPAFGTGTSLAGPVAGGAAATQPQYYTGPYNTGAPSTTPASNSAYGNAYTQAAAAAPQQAASPPYGGGYQSPYQSSGAAGGNAYRTADTRSSYGANAAPSGYGAAQPATSNTWNTDQWGRDARGASQPAGYTEGWAAPASNANPAAGGQSSYLNQNSNIPTNSIPASNGGLAPARSSGYKPGSTARTTGTLSAAPPAGTLHTNSTYSAPASTYAGSAYPSNTAYPSSAYPSTEATAPRTANASTGYAGGFAYPSAPAQPR